MADMKVSHPSFMHAASGERSAAFLREREIESPEDRFEKTTPDDGDSFFQKLSQLVRGGFHGSAASGASGQKSGLEEAFANAMQIRDKHMRTPALVKVVEEAVAKEDYTLAYMAAKNIPDKFARFSGLDFTGIQATESALKKKDYDSAYESAGMIHNKFKRIDAQLRVTNCIIDSALTAEDYDKAVATAGRIPWKFKKNDALKRIETYRSVQGAKEAEARKELEKMHEDLKPENSAHGIVIEEQVVHIKGISIACRQ
jgi:hypothetical protein